MFCFAKETELHPVVWNQLKVQQNSTKGLRKDGLLDEFHTTVNYINIINQL